MTFAQEMRHKMAAEVLDEAIRYERIFNDLHYSDGRTRQYYRRLIDECLTEAIELEAAAFL